LQKQFLAAARAAELAPQESARRSGGACGGDAKDVPDYEQEAGAFYAMFWFEAIPTARKWPARCAWRDCRNRVGELERVASPAT
jgi:hypothetical protein